MELQLATCAESATIDSQTNKLSLINIVEEIYSTNFPGFLPSLSFVLIFSRKRSETETPTLDLRAQLNGTPIFNIPLEVSFQGKLRARAVATLQGFPVTGPGKITISSFWKARALGSWDITVHNATPPMAPSPIPVPAPTTVTSSSIEDKKKRSPKRTPQPRGRKKK